MKIIDNIFKQKEKFIFLRDKILKIFYKSRYIIFFRLVPKKIFLSYGYKKIFGKKLNLKNPTTLMEKIQWKKLYDHQDIYTTCTDKFLVRDFIRKKIGEKYLIPLLYHTDKIDKLDLHKFKTPFIIKTNHGSGQNIIIKNKEDIDKKEITEKFKTWLNTNYYYFSKEWQYKNIKPQVLIEKLLLNEKGQIPEDYKFHCFHGKVEFIQVITDRFGDKKMGFFNTNWKLLPFILSPRENNLPIDKINKNIKKPKNLKEMIKISETLSKEFDYVRVDLYSLKNRIYFGELTFSHGAGFASFFPSKYDRIFGDKLKIKTT